MKQGNVVTRIKELNKNFNGMKVIVGVDRLDYIKGIPQKFNAFETFLSRHPEWVGKVVLTQVAVPSRQDVEEYRNLRTVVNELSGRINGKFGTIDYTPIRYLHKSIPFEELVALYAVSDACLVTSTRDGMNLVSYEYVSCQRERHGVLILSEFAGAAESLNGSYFLEIGFACKRDITHYSYMFLTLSALGSIIVNPWNNAELASAIHEALTMSNEQRKANHKKNYSHVTEYTAAYWGTKFVEELEGYWHGGASPARSN